MDASFKNGSVAEGLGIPSVHFIGNDVAAVGLPLVHEIVERGHFQIAVNTAYRA